MALENITQNKVFGGWHKQYLHDSEVLNCRMQFAIYLPPQAAPSAPVPVLYWLSGLTCTDQNFMQKSGAFRMAAKLGLAIVAMDTSPRGEDVADDDGYDLGQGAGFYLNATEFPWSRHYQMYDYVTQELPNLIQQHFPVSSVRSISGHSMGGHGALTIGLKNPTLYRSISAFSPITHPTQCPWGQKAFAAYLGSDRTTWLQYDTCELIKRVDKHVPVLVDQGESDDFLEEQLKPDSLVAVSAPEKGELNVRLQPGYDHSYFFIASFIDEHLQFHAKHMTE
ncbi:S-formylglutathione hydrolase [Echinimonas agarilytica]|uniref:S-formylglutathione hydrolase n=1 Tax=Echinimonas agarilytica TaxID=1215918 RepID=A0AA41W8Z3_9GAMM|nr:S-formylglutathione hydrolase [Echinimonas agarilytica]MCM2681255.1 S-formylglutathione hydrolase [Echinimonas agarilytica]